MGGMPKGGIGGIPIPPIGGGGAKPPPIPGNGGAGKARGSNCAYIFCTKKSGKKWNGFQLNNNNTAIIFTYERGLHDKSTLSIAFLLKEQLNV